MTVRWRGTRDDIPAASPKAISPPDRGQQLAGKSPFGPPQMDPQSLNWEAHRFQHSAQRWSILDALLDECLGREKLSFLSFAELPFDREIGACNSYSEMGRSPGEEQREGSLVCCQALRQTAPCRLQEPTRRQWFTSSERRAVCRELASPCPCPGRAAKPPCLGEGVEQEPGSADIGSTRATAKKEARGSWRCAGDITKSLRSSEGALVSCWHLWSSVRLLHV